MGQVILVEDNATDSGLAAIAIALRKSRAVVREARSLDEALTLFSPPGVVILGYRALQEAAGKAERVGLPVVGFAANLTDADRRRALAAGIREVYERPAAWRPYCDALEMVLDAWLPQ